MYLVKMPVTYRDVDYGVKDDVPFTFRDGMECIYPVFFDKKAALDFACEDEQQIIELDI